MIRVKIFAVIITILSLIASSLSSAQNERFNRIGDNPGAFYGTK